MDINITAIERSIQLFAGPVIVIFGVMVAMWALSSGANSESKMVANIARGIWDMARWPLLAACVGGVVWFLWRAWQLYRWETGALDGGCMNCAGTMSHRSGKHGDYSVCNMCGSKREGHH
ncbi:hypothetical protein [Pseudomonas marincola]|uniref:hypothetical protein n=1 Tax=Pseudomonas marincola TaxID=437900 RepID=UPI001131B818|nr:hypothetical protein [Pseudomonas marincola]